MKAVCDKTHAQLFFLNAPGGYGKTFLIEVILATVRGMDKIALVVASSGIAAELLGDHHHIYYYSLCALQYTTAGLWVPTLCKTEAEYKR